MKKLIYALVVFGLLLGMVPACAKPEATAPATTQAPPPGTSPSPVPTLTAAPSPSAVAPATGTPQYGGTFKWAKRFGLTGSILPLRADFDTGVYRPAFDSLLKLDKNGEMAPLLATDFKFSPDYKSLTMTLRKGVKFHDGTDLTAETAKWNLLTRKAARRGDYEDVTSIDVIDDFTIRLNLSQYRINLLDQLYGTAGFMYSRTAYEKNGEDWAALNPVGTGAFKFDTYTVSAYVKYKRFDGYWQKGKPYLDSYECDVVNDASTIRFAFERGDFDLAQDLGAKDSAELKAKGSNLMDPYWGAYILVPDSANADSPFANKKVREAMEYAIDSASIAKALGYGLWIGANQLAHPEWAFYNKDIKGRPYDPAKAKQLLADAGLPNGFKTTLYVTTPGDLEVATVTNLKAVGIDASISQVTSPAFTQLSTQGWKNGLLRPPFPVAELTLHTTAYNNFSNTSVAFKSMTRPDGLQDLLNTMMVARDNKSKNDTIRQVLGKFSDDATFDAYILYGTAGAYTSKPHGIRWINSALQGAQEGIWGPEDMWVNK